jgi:hypothetical protein
MRSYIAMVVWWVVRQKVRFRKLSLLRDGWGWVLIHSLFERALIRRNPMEQLDYNLLFRWLDRRTPFRLTRTERTGSSGAPLKFEYQSVHR